MYQTVYTSAFLIFKKIDEFEFNLHAKLSLNSADIKQN
jgi:hypothetical protein